MWISKSELDRLKERISELEKESRTRQRAEGFMVNKYPGSSYSMYPVSFYEVSVKTAVEQILNHLGLDLHYISGQPERVDLQKRKTTNVR